MKFLIIIKQVSKKVARKNINLQNGLLKLLKIKTIIHIES